MALTEEEKKAKRKAEKAAKGGKKKPQQAAAPTTNYQMPNFGNIGAAVGNMATQALPAGNTQLDQALAQPMPNVAELLKSQQGFEKDKAFSMLNSGVLGPVKRDSYGDVRTGPANPWENGTFGTPEEVAQRAQTGRDQRKAEMARPAGQYNIPKPMPTQSPADFVPRGGANGVQNLQDNWNQGISEMPMAGPKTADQFLERINQQYPGLANIRSMPEVASTTPTVPSPTALMDANYAVNRVPTPNELAMVNNDPQVLKAMAQQKAGQEMLAQNAKEGAYWTGVQSDMNNSYKNLDEMIALEKNPMGFLDTYTSFESPERKRELELNQQLHGQVDVNSPESSVSLWSPTQKGVIPQIGSGLANVGRGVTDVVTDAGAGLLNYLMGTNVQGTTLNAQNASQQQPPTMQAPPPSYAQTPGLPQETLMRSMVPYQQPQQPLSSTEQILNNIMDASGFRGALQKPFAQPFEIPTPVINPLMSGM